VTALVQLEVADYALGLRGKVLRPAKLAGGKRPAFCTIVYGLDAADDVADTPLSSAANGYPDAFASADESTRVALPWRRDTEAVLASLVTADGTPVAEDPRNLVRALSDRIAEQGLTPVFGFEYEVHIYAAPAARPRALADLTPFSRLQNAYSLARSAAADELAAEFIARMDAIGITVEAFHSELGDGFFEFALSPQPAVQAADSTARARQYFKDLCAERGLLASFMAKPRADAAGAGGHVHQSIARDGVNVTCDRPGELSAAGRAYLAGLLELMPDLTLLMCPNPNSYRRLSSEFFVAERASWGWDDRNAACRVIAVTTADARVEHRRPGSDASPYLAAAAMLAGGLHGLTAGPELIPPLSRAGSPDPPDPPDPSGSSGPSVPPGLSTPANATAPSATSAPSGAALPGTMAAAITALDESDRARELLGKEFIESYLASRRFELRQFQKWSESQITSWEIGRYLEAL
jgi:glutamine synthetase